MAQLVKNLPAFRETWVWSLGQEDPLEKGMATHSSILTWEIPCSEEPGGLQTMGSQELDMTEWLTVSISVFHTIYTTHQYKLIIYIQYKLIC